MRKAIFGHVGSSRRMQPKGRPHEPNLCNSCVIHFECDYGRAAHGRSPNNCAVVFTPTKVVIPILKPRMKQSNQPPAEWILGRDPVAFGIVANRTSQAKVGKVAETIKGSRDDMLDFKGFGAKILLQSAVFTKEAGSSRNFPAKPCRNESPLCHVGAAYRLSSAWSQLAAANRRSKLMSLFLKCFDKPVQFQTFRGVQ